MMLTVIGELNSIKMSIVLKLNLWVFLAIKIPPGPDS